MKSVNYIVEDQGPQTVILMDAVVYERILAEFDEEERAERYGIPESEPILPEAEAAQRLILIYPR